MNKGEAPKKGEPKKAGKKPANAKGGPKKAKARARPKKTAANAAPKKPKSKKAEESPPFERVWRLVRRVPRGRVITYGQLSRMIDRRLTPVGVGWAIRAAPDGLIPWQRVVNGRGGVSTDDQHPGLQRTILEHEGVYFNRDDLIDLDRYGWPPPDPSPPKKKPAKKKAR